MLCQAQQDVHCCCVKSSLISDLNNMLCTLKVLLCISADCEARQQAPHAVTKPEAMEVQLTWSYFCQKSQFGRHAIFSGDICQTSCGPA